jgi:ketosteroid isomerase-like protein
MSQGNVEAVRRMLDSWNRGDIDAWLRNLQREVAWTVRATDVGLS